MGDAPGVGHPEGGGDLQFEGDSNLGPTGNCWTVATRLSFTVSAFNCCDLPTVFPNPAVLRDLDRGLESIVSPCFLGRGEDNFAGGFPRHLASYGLTLHNRRKR